jgi:hypothetical protein
LVFSFSTNVIPTLDYNAGFLGSGSKALSAYTAPISGGNQFFRIQQ